jgi:hypothetical protein
MGMSPVYGPHVYRPFASGFSFDDLIRLLVVLMSMAIVGWILRILKEGHRYHEIDRGQLARFLGLAGLCVAAGISQVRLFAVQITYVTWIIFAGDIASWYGIIKIRKQQRAKRIGGKHGRVDKARRRGHHSKMG